MATTKDVKIVINPPNFQQVKLKVTGLTPLIQNKMKETIIHQMEDVRAGKAKKSTRTAVDLLVAYSSDGHPCGHF